MFNGTLQQALAPHGFFWAPDPTSAPYSTIAGNLACNAGGPRTVKYGACRDNMLGLRAVNGTGERFRCGGPTTKGATGYDLTRLLIGSEGTLALITEATLKLDAAAAGEARCARCTSTSTRAAHAVARIMAQPVAPCALEFMDGDGVAAGARIGGADLPEAGAMLMIEVDGARRRLPGLRRGEAAAAARAWSRSTKPPTPRRPRHLWAARKALSPALRSIAPNKINEDVVVPVSRMPELVDGVQALSRENDLPIVYFGHAGNGNLHVNLLYHPADAARATARGAASPRVRADGRSTARCRANTASAWRSATA